MKIDLNGFPQPRDQHDRSVGAVLARAASLINGLLEIASAHGMEYVLPEDLMVTIREADFDVWSLED